MIRATKGTSMDGWMDGEVLIIGRVVGWSGGVPKSLVSGEARTPGLELHSFFFRVFLEGDFFFDFCGFRLDFGRFWEAQMGVKIEF